MNSTRTLPHAHPPLGILKFVNVNIDWASSLLKITTMRGPQWPTASLYTLIIWPDQHASASRRATFCALPRRGRRRCHCSLRPQSSQIPLPREALDRFTCGLLPKGGSAGAPHVVEAGLGRAKITCHVNSVDVLVERFGIRLATPRCGLRHGSSCRYHDIFQD